MNKRILSTAAIMAVVAIVLGAFGAHKLKALLSVESLQAFETGVRYQMYHVFLLLFLGGYNMLSIKSKKVLYNLTCIGVLLFSGSIYLLSTQKITGIDFSSIGFITPIGGMVLIVTWLYLLRFFLKLKKS
ncbi:DUF423 domain-containing protein [Pseudofulvibacter geojedonensis]|uniref:DUF423 domain-containing protein n=1 Tax=Pseudofulvibacter geojedonensis TaxID=1123758 RepID=A0ABW3I1F9_9FLAO